MVFERYSDPDRIYHAYKELFEILEKQMPEKLSDWHQKAKERTEKEKHILVAIRLCVIMNFIVF